MAVQVSFEFNALLKKAKELSGKNLALYRKSITTGLTASILQVRGAMRNKAPPDTGKLRKSLLFKVEGFTATVFSVAKHAPFVEFGTKPHFPPSKALVGWARRHGASDPKTAAFLIARAISKRGTKAQPFFAPGIQESRPFITKAMNTAVSRFINAVEGK